jgi:hypothetical protein
MTTTISMVNIPNTNTLDLALENVTIEAFTNI